MTIFIGQNEPEATRRLVYWWLVQSNGTSVATSEAGNRPQWSLNGSAYTNATNTLSAVSANAGQYSLQLTQSETSIPGIMRFRHSSATCFEQSTDGGPVQFVPNNPYNVQYTSQQSKLVGGTSSAVSLGSGETTKDDWFNGSFILLQYANGDLIGNLISDYTGASKSAQLQNTLPTAASSALTYWVLPGTPATPIGDVWNVAVSSYSTVGTFGQILGYQSGSAQSGRNSGISLASTATSTNDFYNNQLIYLTKGKGNGQARIISDYTGATFSAEVNGAWAINPDSTTEYILIPFASIPGATAPTANQNAQAVWEYASLRTVDSAGTVTGFAGSAVSIGIANGTYSAVTINGVTQITSAVSLLGGRNYSDVTVRTGFIAPGTMSGVTVEVNNAAGNFSGLTIFGVSNLDSSVTLRSGTHSGATVAGVSNVAAVASAGRDQIAQSLLSLSVGNNRIVQEYLWPLRNRVQTDPASSTGTVFKPDDTTSAWTFALSTSTLAISGFDPAG